MVTVFVPLLPVTATVVADLERDRARHCGQDVAPYRRTAGSWGAWIGARVRDRGVWRHDVPITLGSVALGFADIVVATLGLTAGFVMVAAPGFWYAWDVGVAVGPWTADQAWEAWLAVPLGLAVLVVTWWSLILISLARDVALRVLGGDEQARLERELGLVRTSRASILEAFEAERRRIERDLHDGAQQDLVALTITLGLLEHTAADLDSPGSSRVRELAARAHAQADRSLVRLRETVHGIHPRELTDHGLAAALTELAARSPLDVEVSTIGDDAGVPSPIAGALYFVVAEALTNVVRHSGADSARVLLEVTSTQVRVEISDTGRGGAVLGDEPGRGTGLAGLRERVRGLGGELTVDSPDGRGTTVVAAAPLPRPGMMGA